MADLKIKPLYIKAGAVLIMGAVYITGARDVNARERGDGGPCHVCTDQEECPSPTEMGPNGIWTVLDGACKLSCSSEDATHVESTCNTPEGNEPCGQDPWPSEYDMGWQCHVVI
jgi:hypothetical protein